MNLFHLGKGATLKNKYLPVLIALFLFSLGAKAQDGIIHDFGLKVRYPMIAVPKTFYFPTGCGNPSGTMELKQSAIYTDSCGHRVWFYDPKTNVWDTLNKAGGGAGGLSYPNAPNGYLNKYGNFVALNTDSITVGGTNKFYTNALARGAFSIVKTPLSYNSSTGAFDFDSTNWASVYRNNTLYPSLSGAYTNPTWINSLAWGKISGAPSFLTSETDPKRASTLAVTGSGTKTITLTLADATTVSGTFTDNSSAGGSGDPATFKAFTSESALRASRFDTTTGDLVAKLLNNKDYYFDVTSTATDDGLFVIKPTSTTTGRWLKIFNGTVTASEANIFTNGSNMTTAINAIMSNATVKEFKFNSGNTTISASTDFQGKVVKFENGAKIIGSGTVTNAIIEAPRDVQIFDTTVAVTGIKNTIISFPWFAGIGDSTTNVTKAAQRFSNLINSLGGGVTAYMGKGKYMVGLQRFTTGVGVTDNYSFSNENIFYIHDCNKPITIEGEGAYFKIVDSLSYGTFDTTTMARVVHSQPYNNSAHDVAQIGSIWKFASNTAPIQVNDITADGNIAGLRIGGGYDNTGWQLEAIGFSAVGNYSVKFNNCKALRNAEDGFLIESVAIIKSSDKKPHEIRNCLSDGNGRQGLSVTGANDLVISNSKFINTGLTTNTNIPTAMGVGTKLVSLPAAGIDFEAEAGNIIYNVVVENSLLSNNVGSSGLIVGASGITFKEVTFIGEQSWALWPQAPGLVFDHCHIIGAVNGAYNASSAEDPNRTRFDYCEFSYDTTRSTTLSLYNTYSDWGGSGAYMELNHPTFEGGKYGINPFVDPSFKIKIIDGTFHQTATTTSHTDALFYGKNTFLGNNIDLSFAEIEGELWINNVMYSQKTPYFKNGADFFNNNGVTTDKNKFTFGYSATVANPSPTNGDLHIFTTTAVGSRIGAVYVGAVSAWKEWGNAGGDTSTYRPADLWTASGSNVYRASGKFGFGSSVATDLVNLKGGAVSFMRDFGGGDIPVVGFDYNSTNDRLRLRVNSGSTVLNSDAISISRVDSSIILAALKSGLTTPSPSGTEHIVTVDANGLVGHRVIPSSGTDTADIAGSGINIIRAAVNRTFKVDTALIATLYQNSLKANIASPTFTGVPLAPTAAPGTNTTQIATTAFVNASTGTLQTVTTNGDTTNRDVQFKSTVFVHDLVVNGNPFPTANADSVQWGVLANGNVNRVNLIIGPIGAGSIQNPLVEYQRNLQAKHFGQIYYSANFGAGFTARSLVDKNYVDSAIAAGPGGGGGGTVINVSSADANAIVSSPTTSPIITIVSAPKWITARTLGMTGDVTYTSSSFDGSGNATGTATVTKVNGVSFAGLATGILKNTTSTGAPSIAVAADFPTLNQNTTGSAGTLGTPRNIYGNAFNGGSDLTQIIGSAFGGTGNGFTKFTGPTTSEKTFTLPNASSTILTDNAAVTVAQGGIGLQTVATNSYLKGNGTSALVPRTYSEVRTDLGLVIGTDVQAYDADLATIAGLTPTTDNFIVSTGSWASRTPAQVKTTLSLNNVDNTSDATKNSASATLSNKTIASPAVTGNMTVAGQYSSTKQTLTYGTTTTWNWNSGTNAEVTLTGNITTFTISNAVAGTYATIRMIQDGTGSRTSVLPTGSKVINGGAGAVTLSTAASSIDLLTVYYDGTNYYWSYGKNYN